MKYYLAVDIGASSGRHILAHLEDGKIVLEEMYRFTNGNVTRDGHLCWELDRLFEEIVNGIAACAKAGKAPSSMGIDTWGVDFVLLDKNNQILGDTIAYRDSRTDDMDKLLETMISPEELYERTGIQKQLYNSIYQLLAIKNEHPEYIKNAEHYLMVPEYFNYLLTGVMMNEYTNATTGQLVNAVTKDWDYELLDRIGIPSKIFGKLHMPKTSVGMLKPEIAKKCGCQTEVILPATHDTGSAVLAVPANDDDFIYLSSGTWSLMGIERKYAECSLKSMKYNFTNEGGYDYRFRYLKNIMGLWMVQSVKKEIAEDLSFGTICEMASKCTIQSIVDANDDRFLAPEHMTAEVQKACEESGQQIPQGIAEVAAVIYNSLAVCYAKTLKELEEQTGCQYRKIHVVGGGANAGYLNRLTAEKTGRTVLAGPTEATAIGNLAVQMITGKECSNLKDARNCIFHSFEIKQYEP